MMFGFLSYSTENMTHVLIFAGIYSIQYVMEINLQLLTLCC